MTRNHKQMIHVPPRNIYIYNSHFFQPEIGTLSLAEI